jgi:hypothetical protein
MMFAITAFMAAAQAQSSYPYPCVVGVNKAWGDSPDLAKHLCEGCGIAQEQTRS